MENTQNIVYHRCCYCSKQIRDKKYRSLFKAGKEHKFCISCYKRKFEWREYD